ncbi:hypothetical protein [Echinicola sediminis]
MMSIDIIKCRGLMLIGLLLMAVCFSSCEEDLQLYDGPAQAHFPQSSDTYFVTAEENPYTLKIGLTNVASSDRTVSISIDENSSTAIEGVDFTINSFQTVIQQGELFGELTIRGDFDNLSASKVVVFNLTQSDGEGGNAGFRQSFTLTLNQFCQYSRDALLGTYVNFSQFWGTGFLCEVVAGNASNEVIVQGMYPPEINGQNIVIRIDQLGEVSYRATVVRQVAFDANTPIFAANYGPLSIEGSGVLNTCGEFNLNLAFTVSAGSFGVFNEVLVKQ